MKILRDLIFELKGFITGLIIGMFTLFGFIGICLAVCALDKDDKSKKTMNYKTYAQFKPKTKVDD